MKIAILTQPLGKNYGGILQAFALQNVIIRLGHDVVIIDRQDNYPSFKLFLWRCASLIKCIIYKYIKGVSDVLILNPIGLNYITDKKLAYEYTQLQHFVDTYISKSKVIRTSFGVRSFLKKNKIDCVIIGSDQVWREEYSPCITDYFAGFLRSRDMIKLVAYAASFGLEQIPIALNTQYKCRNLLKRFDLISVRERTAVDLLRQEWGITSELVLDPTLLFDKSFYDKLIINHCKSKVGLFSYLLDNSDDKKQIVRNISEQLNISVETILLYPSNDDGNAGKLVPMLDWLYNIAKSEFVVTDSYHGCVFSILFNKQFVVVGNKNRGIDRFKTLLEMLDLSERMIYSSEQLSQSLIMELIDYTTINEVIKQKRKESLNFLKRSLL